MGLEAFPLWPFDLHGVTGANFQLVSPFHSRLRIRRGTDRQTDRQTDRRADKSDDGHHRFMPHPMEVGHNNSRA